MTRIKAEQDRQYHEDFLLVASMIHYWRKERPANDELKALSLSVADINTYVQSLQNENKVLHKLINNDTK